MQNPARQRVRVKVSGAVQGVGFRPFVYRLATDLRLSGWVLNSSQGVVVDAEGASESLQDFLDRLASEKPPLAVVQKIDSEFLDLVGYKSFEIRESAEAGGKTALILPDIATCADCLREILDPDDRRYRYPFTNCTNCGPRFSIIETLPYDRPHTSMKHFAMCAGCAREYRDPADRRFHAEPIACAQCGPQLQLWDSLGKMIAERETALRRAAAEIRNGKIVALKGLGGFQLLVDARNREAVAQLRQRKHREEKPFAVMFPSIKAVRTTCAVSSLEEALLTGPESPIVLLALKNAGPLADAVAPGNPNLGVLLPYTPLHHLLLRELNFPVVATSGNLSDEPICIDETEALRRLGGIADIYLVHDRPIVRHMDDSIVRVIHGREMILRRARGYAPLPIRWAHSQPTILAVGAHLKNSVALSVGPNVFISQHIGDLATPEAHEAFRRSAADLPRLYEAQPEIVAHDLHPDYLSTKHAQRLPGRHFSVQHHWGHVASCMAENEVAAPALGVSWDGTGYGLDGTIWGGEFLLANDDGTFKRVAHLRQFRLPGGDRAIKEPRRSALGLLHEIFGDDLWTKAQLLAAFEQTELSILRPMLEKGINSPITSSAGRLFDAVAALIGLRQRTSFEGQAAMELEFCAIADASAAAYPFALTPNDPVVVDWEPAIDAVLRDLNAEVPRGIISTKFHKMLSSMILAVAEKFGEPRVILSGGCFQNRRLAETVVADLIAHDFQPFWHRQIPPNDGGISLGQVIAASWLERSK